MPAIQCFEELEVWKHSKLLNEKIFQLIERGNFKRNYSLIDQIGRSGGSIMDNIAEGFERVTKAEFIQFLGYAKGSCGEFRSQLYRAQLLCYVEIEKFEELYKMADDIGKMLFGLIRYLQRTSFNGIRKKH